MDIRCYSINQCTTLVSCSSVKAYRHHCVKDMLHIAIVCLHVHACRLALGYLLLNLHQLLLGLDLPVPQVSVQPSCRLQLYDM